MSSRTYHYCSEILANWIRNLERLRFIEEVKPRLFKLNLEKCPEALSRVVKNVGQKRQRQRLDLVFRKGRVYYAVEAKSIRRYAFKQLLEEVACFEHDMKNHNEPYEKVIPVLVIVDDKIKKSEPYWAEYEYDNKL